MIPMPKFQVVPLVALAFTVAAGAALGIEDGNAISKPAGEGEAMTKAQDEQPLLDKSADAVPARAGDNVDELFAADAGGPRIKLRDDGGDDEHFEGDSDD